MDNGLETPATAPVRVVVAGSTDWVDGVSAAFGDGDDIAVDAVARSAADLHADALERADCLLTDDPDALSSPGIDTPIVFAVDDLDGSAAADALAAGAAEVVPRAHSESSTLLAHRVRRTVSVASTDRERRRREEWYRALIEQSSDLLAVFDEDGRIVYVSPSIERMAGFDRRTVLKENGANLIHPDDRDHVMQAFAEVRREGSGATRTVEYRVDHPDGGRAVHEAVLTNRLDDATVDGVIGSIRDVTKYHRVERELTESFERVTDAFFALDADWTFTYVNDRAEEIIGVDRRELLGREFLDVLPGMWGTEFQSAALDAMDDQESRTLESYYEPYDIWIEARIYPSPSGISVYFRDVTDRVERERELEERTERLETLVENVPVLLYAIDGGGTVTLSEGRGLENVGIELGRAVGESVFDLFEEYPGVRADVHDALSGEPTHCQRTVSDRVFEMWYRPITDGGEVERVIAVAVDVTERVQYQETLNALHEATSHLLSVESKQTACEYAVDVAAAVLDLDTVLYRFDDRNNELVPAAFSNGFESEVGSPPRLQPNESITWEAFVDGTPTKVDDLDDACGRDVRSGLFVPLGDHGVLVAASTEPEAYDEDAFELAQLFATTAEAALDRIGRTRRLHDRERELKRQNVHLERLHEASRVREDVEKRLLMADSREAIERDLCDRLADLAECSFVWIGEPDPSGNHVRERARAGHDRSYLEAVTATTVDDPAAEPTGRATRARSPVYVENVADAVRTGDWRAEALSRNFQSVYAVPLVYDDFLYGVLSIYADDRDAFDEPLRSTLGELGETIAYAFDAVKRKSALADETRTEVELDIGAGTALGRLATRLDAHLALEGATPQADESTVVFVTTDARIDPDAVDWTIDGIGDATVIAETDDETLLQLQLTEPFLGSVLTSHGATLREYVTDGGETRAIVDVPEGIEIREVLSDIDRRGFAASMVARRDQTTTDRRTLDAPARAAFLAKLTERQREVVQAAYHGGFFEWPRQTTGEAMAESLDISPPAFHKHVRATERKLFAELFDGTATPQGLID